MKSKIRFSIFLMLLLFFCSSTISAQPLYSNYLINPLNNWTGGVSILNKDDTTCFSAIGGGINYFTDKAMLFGKLGNDGQIIYQKVYQEPFTQFYPEWGGFQTLGENSYIVIGSKVSTKHEGFLFQLDQGFDTIGARFFMVDTFQTIARAICILPDNSYIICGDIFNYISSVQGKSEGVFLYKTDNLGNMQWYNTFKPDTNCMSFSVSCTSDHGYVISGHTNSKTDYSGKPLVIKTDSLGNQEWIWQNGSQYDDLQAISTISNDGNILIAYGHATYQAPPWPVPTAETIIRVKKMDNNGNEIWSRDFGSSFKDNQVLSITTLEDGNYLIGGHAWSEDTFYTRAFLLKINEAGDSLWMRHYIYEGEYGTQFNLFSHANTGSDNSILLIGYYQNFLGPTSIQNMWIMHLDSLGCDTPECNPFVGVKKPSIMKEGRIRLYPNPANQFVEITIPEEYKSGNFTNPQVKFYDLNGKLVQESIPENLGISYRCNTNNLKPGIYFVQLIDRNCIIGSNKLLIMR